MTTGVPLPPGGITWTSPSTGSPWIDGPEKYPPGTKMWLLTPYDRSYCAFDMSSQIAEKFPDAVQPHSLDQLSIAEISPNALHPIQSPSAVANLVPLPGPDEYQPGLFLRAPIFQLSKPWVSYFPLKLPDGVRIVDVKARYFFAQSDLRAKPPKQRNFLVNILRAAKWGASHNVHHVVATVRAPGDGQFSSLESGQWIKDLETTSAQTTLYTDRTTILNNQFGYGLELRLNNADSFPPGVLGLGIYSIRVSYIDPS
ncbi:MAG: hypothetical protein HUU55_08650 [Myxococcales bacterium]|nr:hypothetical protein [Myxococcales bacterium]